MKRCEEVQETLAANDFDGPLPAALDDHLKGCAECLQVANLLAGAVEAVRGLAVPPPPLTLVSRALATAAPELAARRAAPSRRLASAAAVTAAVLLALLAVVRRPAPVEPPPRVVASLPANSPRPSLQPPRPRAPSLEPQASSLKPRASSLKPRASSLKPRASSLKPQASSLKPQASSLKPPSWPPIPAVLPFPALKLARHLVRPAFNTGPARFALMGASLRTATLGQGLLRVTDVRSAGALHVVSAPIEGALHVLPRDAGLLIAGEGGIARAEVTTASVAFTRLSTDRVDDVSVPREPGAPALAVAGRRAWRLDLATGRRTELTQLGDVGQQATCAVSPDGRRGLMTARTPDHAGVWDLERGRELCVLSVNDDVEPAWSPDGGAVLVVTRDQRAVCHDASSGRALWQVSCGPGAAQVAISADGRSAAIVAGGVLTLCDALTGAARARVDIGEGLHGRDGYASPGVGFDARGERVYTVDGNGRVRFYDATALTDCFAPGRQPVGFDQLALAPDGRRAAVRGRGTAIQLLNLESGALGEPFGASEGVLLQFDARGALVDVGNREVRIHARGAATRTISLAPATPQPNEQVSGAACDANGDRLFVTTGHGRVASFDLRNGALVDQADAGAYNGLAVDANGSRVLVDVMHGLEVRDGFHAFAPLAQGFVENLQRSRAMAMNRNGTRFAVGVRCQFLSPTTDLPVAVYDAGDGRLACALPGGQSVVTALAFTPDSRALVTGALDGRLRVYDLERRALVQELELPDRPDHVEGLAIDAAGQRLLVGTARGALLRYDLAELPFRQDGPAVGGPGALRTLVAPGFGEPGEVRGAKLLAGERLATIGSDGGLRVRDLESGAIVAEERHACAPGGFPILLGYSPPGDAVLLETGTEIIRFELRGGTFTRTTSTDTHAALEEWRRSAAFHVRWNMRNQVEVVDSATGVARDLAPGTQGTHDYAYHGVQVALVAQGELQAYDARTGERRWMRRVTTPDEPVALAYTADGRTLAVRAESPPAVQLFDAATGAARGSFVCRPGRIMRHGLSCTPGGRLVTAMRTGEIECRDLATGDEAPWSSDRKGRLVRAALSGDGSRAAWRELNGALEVADVATGRRRTLSKTGATRALALSGDGLHLVEVDADQVRGWDLTGAPKNVAATLPGTATGGAQVTPDLSWLVRGKATGEGAQIELVDLRTRTVSRRWPVGDLNFPLAVATTADARVVAAALENRVVVPGRPPMGDPRARYGSYPAPEQPELLALSADGAWAATANDAGSINRFFDPTVRLYDVRAGGAAVGLGDHREGVTCLRFLEGARFLITGGADGRVRLFDVARRTLLAELALPNLPDQPLAFATSADDRRVLITTARGAVYLLER